MRCCVTRMGALLEGCPIYTSRCSAKVLTRVNERQCQAAAASNKRPLGVSARAQPKSIPLLQTLKRPREYIVVIYAKVRPLKGSVRNNVLDSVSREALSVGGASCGPLNASRRFACGARPAFRAGRPRFSCSSPEGCARVYDQNKAYDHPYSSLVRPPARPPALRTISVSLPCLHLINICRQTPSPCPYPRPGAPRFR